MSASPQPAPDAGARAGSSLTLAEINRLGPVIDPDLAIAHEAFSHVLIEQWEPIKGLLKIYFRCSDFPIIPGCGPVHACFVTSVPSNLSADFLRRHGLTPQVRPPHQLGT